MPYDVIDHTADIGIRVWAADLPSLFVEAGRALFELIAGTAAVSPEYKREIAVEGTDETDLLINWLRELLYMFEGKSLIVGDISIKSIKNNAATGHVAFEPFDLQKHEIITEIKAVTYAGGDIQITGRGLEVTVIFDI